MIIWHLILETSYRSVDMMYLRCMRYFYFKVLQISDILSISAAFEYRKVHFQIIVLKEASSKFSEIEQSSHLAQIPVSNYMFKVNKRNTRTRCEICSNVARKTPEPCCWGRSCLVLVFLLLTLSR